MTRRLILLLLLFCGMRIMAQPTDYVWTSASKNSSESMPCGGGSIGMNVWVEDGDILFYLSRSGSFDENNTLLKNGRFRIHLTPALNTVKDFRQRLVVKDGYVEITDGSSAVQIWADVFRPVVHVEMTGRQQLKAEVSYESWRYADHPITGRESRQTSYKFAVPDGTLTRRDSLQSQLHQMTFFHVNPDSTVFDATVRQQGLSAEASRMYNPLGRLIFGGRLIGDGLTYVTTRMGEYQQVPYRAFVYRTKTAKSLQLQIIMATCQGTVNQWMAQLEKTAQVPPLNKARTATRNWWNQFWQRSFIECQSDQQALSRNYTLFRYMMGCNAYSEWPTKFNGGLFTFDPNFVNHGLVFSPDFRLWGGGTHTAQNQRLLYWPLLKSGDEDILKQALEFYRRILPNAEIRSEHYWHHGGACFTEQLENFGLPQYDEYGKKRPDGFDPGLQYNAWLIYTWDTALEFCEMALQSHLYAQTDIKAYIPLIRSCLDFFNEHYRYLAKKRGIFATNDDGKLILYPGSSAETFKMTTNSTSTIGALRTVAEGLVDYLTESGTDTIAIKRYRDFISTLPDISFREVDGYKVIAPAQNWEHVKNIESTMLYPVFPWRQFGVGKPDLEVARNTYLYDDYAKQFRSHVGWKQDLIWAADLGLTDEAARLLKLKLQDGPYRFPAFWGPGFDWSPDHNWGGSGMIGIQDMLLQETGDSILLFPAWPKDWEVHFRLHATMNTTVEAAIEGGKVKLISVQPKAREKDIVICQ